MDATNKDWTWATAVLAASLTLATDGARAGSACVNCSGPDAVYSCSVAPDENGNTAVLSNHQLQYNCIQDIARRYLHESCSVKRNQLGDCNGQVHMMARQADEPPKAPAAVTAPAPAGTQPKQAERSGEPGEPKTVVELAKRTADTTKKEMDQSAKTVSKAARSTWRCITTLFSEC